jgi:hypothetical protein
MTWAYPLAWRAIVDTYIGDTKMCNAPYNKQITDVLDILDKEAGDAQPHKRVSRLMLALEALVVAAICYVMMRYLAQGSLVLSITYSAAMTVGVLWLRIRYENYAFYLHERLHHSGILERIAIGPQELAKIYDYTPWPWSLLILGPRPRHLRGWIKLVARNLDWYLAEPRLLVRFESVGYVACWGLYIVFAMLWIAAPMGAHSAFEFLKIPLLTAIPAANMWAFSKQKRIRSAALLRDYLKDMLRDDCAE